MKKLFCILTILLLLISCGGGGGGGDNEDNEVGSCYQTDLYFEPTEFIETNKEATIYINLHGYNDDCKGKKIICDVYLDGGDPCTTYEFELTDNYIFSKSWGEVTYFYNGIKPGCDCGHTTWRCIDPDQRVNNYEFGVCCDPDPDITPPQLIDFYYENGKLMVEYSDGESGSNLRCGGGGTNEEPSGSHIAYKNSLGKMKYGIFGCGSPPECFALSYCNYECVHGIWPVYCEDSFKTIVWLQLVDTPGNKVRYSKEDLENMGFQTEYP